MMSKILNWWKKQNKDESELVSEICKHEEECGCYSETTKNSIHTHYCSEHGQKTTFKDFPEKQFATSVNRMES